MSNWVLETRSQVFARANPNVNFTFFLDNIMLFVFFLGFLTSACENKPLHVLYYLFTFCESVWARVLEINSQVSSHAYVISGHLLRSDPVGKHKHFKIWCVFVEKSCNIFLELIHVVKGFLCFFYALALPPIAATIHWPHSQRCARYTKVAKRMQSTLCITEFNNWIWVKHL